MPNLEWTFYVTLINLLLMKYKFISVNIHWIGNNFIAHNLLINYLNLIRVNKEAVAHRCSVAVFKKSEAQVFFKIGVLKNFANFTGKHLYWSLFIIKLQVSKFPMNIAEFRISNFCYGFNKWRLVRIVNLRLISFHL